MFISLLLDSRDDLESSLLRIYSLLFCATGLRELKFFIGIGSILRYIIEAFSLVGVLGVKLWNAKLVLLNFCTKFSWKFIAAYCFISFWSFNLLCTFNSVSFGDSSLWMEYLLLWNCIVRDMCEILLYLVDDTPEETALNLLDSLSICWKANCNPSDIFESPCFGKFILGNLLP